MDPNAHLRRVGETLPCTFHLRKILGGELNIPKSPYLLTFSEKKGVLSVVGRVADDVWVCVVEGLWLWRGAGRSLHNAHDA